MFGGKQVLVCGYGEVSETSHPQENFPFSVTAYIYSVTQLLSIRKFCLEF